jgi:hypothetical protein
VIAPLEQRHKLSPQDADLLARVRTVRQRILASLERAATRDVDRKQLQAELDNLFFVEQLSCYPTDYDTEHPALHRMAETIDKLEEDVLGLTIAPPRGPRRATLTIGEPIAVDPAAQDKISLTRLLENRVQQLLDAPRPSERETAHAHSP